MNIQIEHTLNIKPLSVNKAYKTTIQNKYIQVKGKKIKKPYPLRSSSKDYTDFKKQIEPHLKNIPIELINRDELIELNIVFGVSNHAADVSNQIKTFEDCLMKHYDIDDKQVYSLNVRKKLTKKGEEYIQYKITKINGDDYEHI